MFSQSTRLELTIVVAAFLVLLLCRQPPKSGNAGVVKDAGVASQQAVPEAGDRRQKMDDGTMVTMPSAAGTMPTQEAPSPGVGASLDATTSDNTPTGAAVPPQPKLKRVAVVDATKCKGLNYKDIMFGEVTVQWIWDGQKSVPHKVCEVKEKDGTISTWSFDNNDGIVVSELPEEPVNK